MASASDPDYGYLLNSLKMALGHTPDLVVHPGTTTELFGAVLLRLIHIFKSPFSSLTSDVLQNSEFYLNFLWAGEVLLTTSSLILVGWIALLSMNSISYALIAQSFPFLGYTVVTQAIHFSPDPFLIIWSQIIASIVILEVAQHPFFEKKRALILGASLGLGFATKITFIPLFAIIFIRPDKIFIKKVALTAILVGFVCLLPIHRKWGEFLGFSQSLLSHTGMYGNGDKYFLNFGQSWLGFKEIIKEDPSFLIFFLGILLYALLLFKGKIKNSTVADPESQRGLRALTILVAAFALQLIMTFKHPGSSRYLLPSMSMSGLIILLCVRHSRNARLRFPKIQWAILFMTFTVAMFFGAERILNRAKIFSLETNDQAQIHDIISHQFTSCQVIEYYLSSSLPMALDFGNQCSARYFTKDIQALYPTYVQFDPWSGQMFRGSDIVKLDFLKSQSCLLLRGPLLTKYRAQFLPKFPVQSIFEGLSEALYKVQ